MRVNIPIIANGVAIAMAVGCFLAAFLCDRQYAQAHHRADYAIHDAQRSGVDFDAKALGVTSPEIYYQRAKTVRQWAVPIWLLALAVAWVTRKWIPAVAATVIMLLTL